MNLHNGEVAHTLILGMTGSGKSYLANFLLQNAQKYAPLREDGLAEIGLAYPLIRQILLEVGYRFAQHKVIACAEDIFWLTQAEGLRRVFLLFRDILAGSFIPLAFFPDFFQKLFLFLPFQFISYVPIRVFLGKYELAGITMPIPQIVAIQALAVLLMWGVSEIMYRAAIKHFTGVGA